MRRGVEWLIQGPVIAGFFIATLLASVGFYFVQQYIDGPLLDSLLNGDDAMIRLAALSPDQKLVHFRATAILDMIYPVLYFGFFAGLTARLAGPWRLTVMLPVLVAAIADYLENTVQAVALSGGAEPEILLVKNIVTPIKFGGLAGALALLFVLAFVAMIKRVLGRKEDKND